MSKNNETDYGNFAGPKREQISHRSEDVVLTAIERCEELTKELEIAYQIIGELNVQLRKEKKDEV